MRLLIYILISLSAAEGWAVRYGLNSLKDVEINKSVPSVTLAVMPKVRSQDSVGLCAAFAAAVLIDQANCQAAKMNMAECMSVADEKRASTLDLSRFSEIVKENADRRSSYPKIKEGGWTPLILQNALATKKIANESCAPFVQITSGIENPDGIEAGLWNRYEDTYKKYKRDNDEVCPTCEAQAASVKSEFALRASNTEILKSFGQNTYNEFLDKLLIPKECGERKNSLKLLGSWQVATFPEKGTFSGDESEDSKKERIVSEVKNVLANLKRPVSIEYCGDTPFDKNKSCSNGHAVVIKGYRNVCSKADKNKCRNMFQVQNSWGESWQQNNDDGWVDGDELMARTKYEAHSFTWLEDAPVEQAGIQ